MVLFEGLYAGAMGGAFWVILGLVFAFILIRGLLIDFPGRAAGDQRLVGEALIVALLQPARSKAEVPLAAML